MNIQNILKAGVIVAITAIAATSSVAEITTVNGVAAYPDDYNGRPVRAANEDPFLSPLNSALILIDYQPGILWPVTSIDHEELMNNTEGLIKSAVLYDIPIIFSHVAVGFSGYEPMIEELSKLAPNAVFIDRTSVNAWEEPEFVAAVEATGRHNLIMGGLWTDVCLAYPAIEAEAAGYDVFVAEDTVGSITQMSHDNGMTRMLNAGVEAITWNVVPTEFQRDHARQENLGGLMEIYGTHLF